MSRCLIPLPEDNYEALTWDNVSVLVPSSVFLAHVWTACSTPHGASLWGPIGMLHVLTTANNQCLFAMCDVACCHIPLDAVPCPYGTCWVLCGVAQRIMLLPLLACLMPLSLLTCSPGWEDLGHRGGRGADIL